MRLAWSVLALEDRDSIMDYIAANSPDMARVVDERIEAQTDMLGEHPFLGRPGRIPGSRELVLEYVSYIVAYVVSADTVNILRVIHGARQWPTSLA